MAGYQQPIPAYLMQDAPTELRGQVFELRPGQVLRFAGGPIGRHRKYIRITNEDVNTALFIVAGDEQGIDPKTTTVKLAKLAQNAFIELWTNATITVKNISASEIVTPVPVLELFYK
jgi:hypothetical protein